MSTTSVKNIKILEKYISIVQELYMEPEEEIIMGYIVFDSFPSDTPKIDASKSKIKLILKRRKQSLAKTSNNVSQRYEKS